MRFSIRVLNFWGALLVMAMVVSSPGALAKNDGSKRYGGDGFITVKAFASGEQELPDEVTTKTRAVMFMNVQRDYSRIKFRLRVMNGVDVTMAHLHCGQAGSNGPVLVGLFEDMDGVQVNGVLACNNELRNADIVPQQCGTVYVQNVASLYAAVRSGDVYLNVHTKGNPAGEVRGQFFV